MPVPGGVAGCYSQAGSGRGGAETLPCGGRRTVEVGRMRSPFGGSAEGSIRTDGATRDASARGPKSIRSADTHAHASTGGSRFTQEVGGGSCESYGARVHTQEYRELTGECCSWDRA